eukprot:7006832-Pyramimonas_sp.AAC.1
MWLVRARTDSLTRAASFFDVAYIHKECEKPGSFSPGLGPLAEICNKLSGLGPLTNLEERRSHPEAGGAG